MFESVSEVAPVLVGLVLPVVVAVFTRPSTNSTVKATAHGALSTITGFYAVWQNDPDNFNVWAAVGASLLAWLTGTAFYQSLLRKYAWFAKVQNLVVKDRAVSKYYQVAEESALLAGGKDKN